MLEPSSGDSILVRCMKCNKLFQPPRPLIDDSFSPWVAGAALAENCPVHPWPEVIEESATAC